MARFFIDNLAGGYRAVLGRAFDCFAGSLALKPSDRVAIKPNLTYPTYRPGVMTSPEMVEALVETVRQYTPHITICESDSGGYSPFPMSEVFRETGLEEMARRLGARIVNLTHEPSRNIAVQAGWRRLRVPLPRLLLDETDVFITAPVFKVHLNTVMSGAIKNQWGVIQQPAMRLKLHPYFQHVIHAVNRAMPRSYAVFDGRYGLNRSGPMIGDPEPLDCLAMCDSLFHADLAACAVMRLDWREIPYLAHIFRKEGIGSLADLTLHGDLEPFRRRFYLERKWTDYPGLACFRSRALAYVGYESPAAEALHWLLYRFRKPFY